MKASENLKETHNKLLTCHSEEDYLKLFIEPYMTPEVLKEFRERRKK
jgi:hypothetical protein